MTPEEAIAKITESEPRFIATETDDAGIAYFGCVTKEGRSAFKVETANLFTGQNLSEKSTPEELQAASRVIAGEMIQMRKALLWRCLGHLVTEDIGKDLVVTKFVAEVVHVPQKPELVTPDDFHQMFQSQN